MASKKFIRKIISSVLTLSLILSLCAAGFTTALAVTAAAEQDGPVYDIDFDNFAVAVGTEVDGTRVSGAAYSIVSATQKDGTTGNVLKIHLSDAATRGLALNNTSEWLKLDSGKYKVTYDYKVEAADGTGTTTLVRLSKIYKKDDGFYLGADSHDYNKTAVNLVDGDAVQDEWQSNTVVADYRNHTEGWFGILATTGPVNVYLDNIKIYAIGQPTVYDFDSHDFCDGIVQDAANNEIDGLDGTTENTNTAFLPGIDNKSEATVLGGNGGFFNVVNVDKGKSRSYYKDGAAVAYNDSEAYAGLSGNGHGNALRIGWNGESTSVTSDRAVMLNNGAEPLTLSAGTYQLTLDYYIAGDAALQEVQLQAMYNVKSAVQGMTVLMSDGTRAATVFYAASGAETGKWVSYSGTVVLQENADSFGFAVFGANKDDVTRGTEIFLDNIKLTQKVDPGENTWNFDYGVNAVNTGIKSGGTYKVGVPEEVTADGNAIIIAINDGSTNEGGYNGQDRAAMLLTNGNAKHLDKGIYQIKFNYAFKASQRANTYTDSKIGFGAVNNKDSFTGKAVNEFTFKSYVTESALTSGKTEGVWYSETVAVNVTEESGIDLCLGTQGLNYHWYIDDITVTELEDPGDNAWNFDYGVNAVDGGKKSGGVYSVDVPDVPEADGKALVIATADAYDGGMRTAMLLSNGEAKHLDKGDYRIEFKYAFAAPTKERTNTVSKIEFGSINNKSAFAGTVAGEMTPLLTVSEASLTNGKTEGTWYTASRYLTVEDENGIDFGLSVTGLNHYWYIDDIKLTRLEDAGSNTWNFDYGYNKGAVTAYNDTNKIGGSGVFGIEDTQSEQGKALVLPCASRDQYNGAERAIVLNNGAAQAKITAGKWYKLSFKYNYAIDTDFSVLPVRKNAEGNANWNESETAFKLITVDSAKISGDFAKWYCTQLHTVGSDKLTADGSWHEYSSGEFYVSGSGDIIIGLSATYLCGIMYVDDIKLEEASHYEIVSGSGFTVDGNYVIMDSANMYASELKDGSGYGEFLTVKRGDSEIDGDVFVATGDTVELKIYDIDNPESVIGCDKKTVAVPFDVNGDGSADLLDLVRLKKIAAGAVTAENEALLQKAVGGELNATGVANLKKALLTATPVNHSVTVDGAAISEYVIVNPKVPSALWTGETARLARAVKKHTGYEISVKTEATEGKRSIVIDNTAESDAVTLNNGTLTVGGSDYYIYTALSAMTAAVKAGNADLARVTPNAEAAEYELVWSDEFNGTSLDSTVWGDYSGNPDKRWSVFQLGNTEGLTENEDGKVLQPDADGVEVSDGTAKITVECNDTTNYKDATYTNRQPVTQGRLGYRYGLYEIRAKLPEYPAAAALWSTGNGLEIDLVEGHERVGGGYTFAANVHITNPNGTGNRVAHSYDKYDSREFVTDVDFTADFHTYSVLWTPDVLEFSVDGEVFWTLNLNEFDVNGTIDSTKQYLLLGASYCSTADNVGYCCSESEIEAYVENGGKLPEKTDLEVDYVRLYQAKSLNSENKADNISGKNYFKIG